jgi:hypothetical protein
METFGIRPAPYLIVRMALIFLDTLPEPGRLALIGLALIVSAVLLRKFLIRVHPALESPKADVQVK